MQPGIGQSAKVTLGEDELEVGRYVALLFIAISVILIVFMFADQGNNDEDFKYLSDSFESEKEITDDYQTMRSLGTDMMTHKMSNFKYNQSLVDVLSVKDSMLANYNNLDPDQKRALIN